MSPDYMYDPNPYNTQEWWAVFFCDDCGFDRDHQFVKQRGVTEARCETCGHVTDIDPDDYEE